jgi:AAA family ATP:ADP antiporter
MHFGSDSAMRTSGAIAKARGPLDRILGAFSEMRPGEAGTALLLTLNVFLLLLAYYLLKVAREPLILLGGGAPDDQD